MIFRPILAGFFGLMLCSASVRADVLVLVHGYMGSAWSWEESGIAGVLEAEGWGPGGLVSTGPGGVHLLAGSGAGAAGVRYSVELPSLAPIMVQAGALGAMLDELAARHPGEALHLVAHSAGGVVARAYLVGAAGGHVASLITIAAPHLGTHRAIEALEETDGVGPVGWVKDWLGGDLYHQVKRSWGVLLDLTPARPGNLLYWLNGQPHPPLRYVAVLRGGPAGLGDELVPVFSQDLNNLAVLRGRVETYITPVAHALNPEDGRLIARLLARSTPGE